jgi:YVTN family beta-propeller protein
MSWHTGCADGCAGTMRPVSDLLIRLAIITTGLLCPTLAQAADGEVYLYLQALPDEAAGLTFTIASLSAVGGDGSEYPLTLNLTVVERADAGRQRLLASGRLPIGTYAGFALRLKRATLKAGREETRLSVPDAAVRLNFPMDVAASQASVVWLVLRYEDSVMAESAFDPVFSVRPPPRPIAQHAGYVTNTGSNTLTVFDRNIGQVVGVVDTCAGPSGMALDQPRRRLYVACSQDDEIQAIDVVTGDIVERTRVTPGDRPGELAVTPDGTTLLSANTGSNSASVFDALSLTRVGRINVGSGPGSIVIDPSGRRAFVLNTFSSSISVIDIAGRSIAATLSTDPSPLRAQFGPAGDRLYVIHERSPYMTVLDARQLTLVTRARLRIGVSAIAVDTVRDLICIGGPDDPTIDFYDPNALMPLFSMRTPAGPTYLTFDAENNSLYIVSRGARTVGIARLTNRKVVSQMDVGDAPYAVAVMGER